VSAPPKMLASIVFAILLAATSMASAVDFDSMPTPELQQRYDGLIHELRCMQCQNESIADSPVDLAADLRRDVREQLIAGKTDAQIRDSMVARYGNIILFRPPFIASTAWVWLAPFALLIVGVLVAARIVRQRAAMVASDDSVVDADDVAR
jgi:cytochrome c-type biogenesis protein CcmH